MSVLVGRRVRGGRVPLLARREFGSFWPRRRVRRPVDVALLLLAAGTLTVLVVLVLLKPASLSATARVVPHALTGAPRAALSVANVVASLAVLAVLLAIAVDSVRSRRFALTSAAAACALGVVTGPAVALICGSVTGGAAVTLLLGPPHESAGLPVTAAVALVVGADLQRRRWLSSARLSLGAAIASALALASLTVPSAVYAVLVGTAAGLGVRVAVGVVPARPPDELVQSALARAGLPLPGLRLIEELAGRVRYAGVTADGRDLRVTVVDPDRRGVPLARRAWRLVRLRTAAVGRPAFSMRGQLERQALTCALAESAGVAAPRVLALLTAGPALVLVEQPIVGAAFAAANAPVALEGTADAWSALRRLHDAGLAHGALAVDAVVLLPTGGAGFADLVAAQPATTELQRELDVVALLVATASRVGAAVAVAALRADYGISPAAAARLAALLQPLALPWQLRRAVRGTPLLGDLRTALHGPGTDSPVPALRLERLRPRTVLSVAGATLAAHILATQLSRVGIGSALRQAQAGWLAVAILASAATYVGAALALQAFVPATLPLARTALVQVASSFVTLVTPPTVGQVGLNIRYLQRAGVPTATAAASVAVKEALTIAVTVPVLLLCVWLSGASASRLTLLPSGKVLAVLLLAAVALALGAAAPPIRRLLRHRLEPLVRRTLPQLLAAASDPRRLGTAVAGILVLNGGDVLALDASLHAFSASVALPTLVVVYLAASTVGSAAPTPGGLGAVEAAFIGGLTAAGVPAAAAVTAVLAFRTATFWLPAPIGWAAFVVLQRRGRL